VADAKYKYHEYVGYPAEFFDLEQDPGETVNLADAPGYQELVARYAAKLRAFLDPVETDRSAKHDQALLIEAFGGREKAMRTGTPGATPIPTSYAR
ncbi:MAG: sulfatase, partial [Noviherbaspirillum sp.]